MAKAKLLGLAPLLFLLCWPQAVLPQDTPRLEVFGGYSYMPLEAVQDFHGFNVSFTGKWNRLLGVTADVSGHFATETSSSLLGQPAQLWESRFTARAYFLHFGPQLSFLRKGRFTLFGHALFGLAHRSLRVIVSPPSLQAFSVDSSDTGFSMAHGGGLDIDLSRQLAIRAFRTDYLFSRLRNLNHHDLRLASGIVVRFGKR